MGKPAVFLDRDGVINWETHYLFRREDFHFMEGTFEGIRYLRDKGFLLFILTNQSGIARGFYQLKDFYKLSQWLLEQLDQNQAKIDKIYFCPHLPSQNCICRKPKPGNIFKAQEEFHLDLSQSWIIGDQKSDLQLKENAGLKYSILIQNEHSKKTTDPADFVFHSLGEIIDHSETLFLR